MHSFFNVFHILFCVILVAGVLLQPGDKGGGLGSAFGGGGANTAFGAQGAAPVLAKITYYIAAVYLATSILIEYNTIKQNRSVLEKLAEPKPAAASTLPNAGAAKPAAPAVPTAPAPV